MNQWTRHHLGCFSPLCLQQLQTRHTSRHKSEVTEIWLYQFSRAHCHCTWGSPLGAGWVNRCEGVRTKAHLFGVCWTKQLGARWMEGPWGAPNSSVAWLLNSLTMLRLKPLENDPFYFLSAENVVNSATA